DIGAESRVLHAKNAVSLLKANPNARGCAIDIAYGQLIEDAQFRNAYQEAVDLCLEQEKWDTTYEESLIGILNKSILAECYLSLDNPKEAAEILDTDEIDRLALVRPRMYDFVCRVAFRTYRSLKEEIRAIEFADRLLDEDHLLRLDHSFHQDEATQARISELENENALQESEISSTKDRLRVANAEALRLQNQNQKTVLFATIVFVITGTLIAIVVVRTRLAQSALELANQRLSTEERIRKSEQRHHDSLGQMAGGVAHDFNNILTCILTNAEFVKFAAASELDQNCQQSIDAIVHSTVRASELSNQMLTYAGKRAIERKVCDLRKIARINCTLLSEGKCENEVLFSPNSAAILVDVDEIQINQVLLNLIGNARKASQPGQTIEVETDLVEFIPDSDTTRFVVPPPAPGHYALLEVRDTGKGFSTRDAKQYFEPFFSQFGEGRGLGLAVVYGVITAHSGAIEAFENSRGGTSFRIYLPITEKPATSPGKTDMQAEEDLDGPSLLQGKNVLIVDDEADVRDSIAKLLARMQANVNCCKDGLDAIETLSNYAPDVILLDIVMPNMDGPQFLNSSRTNTPIVIMTGNSKRNLHAISKDPRVVAVLEKPFSAQTMNSILLKAIEYETASLSGRLQLLAADQSQDSARGQP
ncbi:MAG: response regulator, partial [Planctomycetota bacterium]